MDDATTSQIFSRKPRGAGCFRLPAGFARLRPAFGETIREHRKALFGKQQTLAEVVGIARETLSRIESGRAVPRPETMDLLLLHLELDWDAVAVRGEPQGASRPFDDSFRGDDCRAIGERVRVARRRRGLSIMAAAAGARLSPAQLSRIERGMAPRSSVLALVEEDLGLPPESRRRVLIEPFLLSLIGDE